MLSNKKILITNDDGIEGFGLLYLVKEIAKYSNNILIVVPSVEMSAVSHQMTLRRGLKLEKQPSLYNNIETYTVDGSPCDCVKVAIHYLNFTPDYIISGMNDGLNLGCDILYSGTIAACFEAGLYNIPSIAFSCDRKCYEASKNISSVIEYISNNEELKKELILNVNMPINPIGFKKTHQGKNPFDTHYELKDGLLYAKGTPLGHKINQNLDTDVLSYHTGYISITPLTIDRTKY